MIKIVLKEQDDIKENLEEVEYEDKKYLAEDGVAYAVIKDEEIVTPFTHATYDVMGIQLNAFSSSLQVKYEDTEYEVPATWVKSLVVKDKTYKFEKPIDNTKYIKLNEKLYLQCETLEVIEHDGKTCKCCNTPLIVPAEHDICDTCLTKLTDTASYNYRPDTFNFIGEQIAKDKENPIWYGIELEYGLNKLPALASMMNKYKDKLYLVSDGSIHGGEHRKELVSHPHSFKTLMSDSYLEDLPTLDVDQQKSSNGCHIHISRSAFKDSKHYGLFYFLIYSNKDLLEHIAGRQLTDYCKLEATGKIHNKDKSGKSGSKSVAVNELHDDTIEIRIFNSTNDPVQVKRYIQFLDSLIKYTKYHKKQVSLDKWLTYVKKYSRKYKILADHMAKFEKPLTEVVTYTEPKTIICKPKDITFTNIQDIAKIVHIDGGTTDVSNYTPNYIAFRKEEDYTTIYMDTVQGKTVLDTIIENIKHFVLEV